MNKIIVFFKREFLDFKILLRNIPAPVVAFYVIALVCMNILANKEIHTGLNWLALDCGIIFSWLVFLSMDVIVRRFGPKASIKVSLFALFINLVICLIFFAASKIPGNWGEFYTYESQDINSALNGTIGNNWFVVMGSSIAFISSAIVNSLLHYTISKLFKKKGAASFIISAHISTFIGQFIDNFLFAIIVSINLFGWNIVQCVTCAITGALVEMLCELLFSWIGYRIVKKWETEDVGKAYLDYCEVEE